MRWTDPTSVATTRWARRPERSDDELVELAATERAYRLLWPESEDDLTLTAIRRLHEDRQRTEHGRTRSRL